MIWSVLHCKVVQANMKGKGIQLHFTIHNMMNYYGLQIFLVRVCGHMMKVLKQGFLCLKKNGSKQ